MVRVEILEKIQAATPGDKVLSLSLLAYNQLPVTADLLDNDIPAWKNVNELINNVSLIPFIYNLPANSQTPIIINFLFNTIKIGAASAISIGGDLSNYQSNPDVKFKIPGIGLNTKPTGNEGWITNEEWSDSTYTSLVELTLQPDTDTGMPGGLTMDNINIVIKP